MVEAVSFFARVAELADAYGSGPYGETRGGSSPLVSTIWNKHCSCADDLSNLVVWTVAAKLLARRCFRPKKCMPARPSAPIVRRATVLLFGTAPVAAENENTDSAEGSFFRSIAAVAVSVIGES